MEHLTRRSLRLDIGRPDHLAPFLGFVSNQLAEVGGRARKHRAAKVGKPRLQLGIGEPRVDRLAELIDDIGGRADAISPRRLVAWHEAVMRRPPASSTIGNLMDALGLPLWSLESVTAAAVMFSIH